MNNNYDYQSNHHEKDILETTNMNHKIQLIIISTVANGKRKDEKIMRVKLCFLENQGP
jgi:hypothetical protein